MSCSPMVESICKIGLNKIEIAIQRYKNKNAEYAIVDIKKRELIKTFGNNPFNLFNISDDKKIIICSKNFKEEEGNKNKGNLINYIKIENKIKDGNKCFEFKNCQKLLSYKYQFSNIIELQPGENQNKYILFYCLITGCNIFIISIDFS